MRSCAGHWGRRTIKPGLDSCDGDVSVKQTDYRHAGAEPESGHCFGGPENKHESLGESGRASSGVGWVKTGEPVLGRWKPRVRPVTGGLASEGGEQAGQRMVVGQVGKGTKEKSSE